MDEYKRGLLYMVAKASTAESVSGVPMQIIYNGPFENELGKGIFTHRIIHLGNRLPEWGRKLLLKGGKELQVEEKSWNAFPYIKTIYSCPLFDEEKFEIVVESRHAEDTGTTENIHSLSPSQLKKRTVDFIDIVGDKVEPRYYKREEDPEIYKSKKTGRGPLKRGFQNSTKPVMCAYKLVSVNFNYWGLRTKVEKLIQEVIRNIYLTIHRQAFCWLDEWYDLSFDKLRVYEDKMLPKQLQEDAKPTEKVPSRWTIKSKL